jgi:hypothetical protein
MDLSGYKAIPKPSSNRDLYTAVKVYITFLKGLYAHPEHSGASRTPRAHSGASNTHTRITGASHTHTQSALWCITYAHPERTLGRQIRTPRAHYGASQIKYYNNCIPYTMYSKTQINTHTQSAVWGVINKNTNFNSSTLT